MFATPLSPLHRAAGARMVEFAGWEMPLQYVGIIEEHRAVRRQAGIFDVSHMGRLKVTGSQALALLQWLFTTDVAALRDGQGQYTALCHLAGGILDDCVLYRRRETHFLLVCNASNRPKLLSWLGGWQRRYPGTRLADRTEATAMLAVQGPAAPRLVQETLGPGLLAPPRFHCARGSFQGQPVLAARTGYTGEDGFELVCEAAQAPALWRALVERGATPCGLGARDTLRLEAALPLYGNDLDEAHDPLSAGLERLVRWEKGPFLGREALAHIRDRSPVERLVGLQMRGREIARHGYPIMESGHRVGAVTSGSHAPWLGCNIALGYVESRLAGPGARLQVEVRGRAAEAVVVTRPFYRRGAPAGRPAPTGAGQETS